MEKSSTLPEPIHPTPLIDVVKALACPADSGHFDELQGTCATAKERQKPSDWSPAWQAFFGNQINQGPNELDRACSNLARQVRDNGITYNVYADQDGPQRPWALDLFPLILDASTWQTIEQGVQQRAELLERVMADVYGS